MITLRGEKGTKAQIWIETVIYTLIAFVILGAVLGFAKPKIEELQDKSIIEQSLKSGAFHQQDIAQQFDISTKTLQRRLTASGLNFQTILDDTRLELAKQHLTNSELNLNEISVELGFKEPRSFYRWFNKLTQQTPGEYRKAINNQ